MTLAVTLMIRDEADILPAWLEYHLAQGVDVFVITDNGSEDGTTALLQEFADRAADLGVVVDLRHDPVHRKQQGEVVTRMARDAATVHRADWVVNADADEFLMAKDRTLTLGQVFAQLDQAVGAFFVPVVNLVGPMAVSGAGVERLHWRDQRSDLALHEIGLLAQPTANTVHIGDPDVTVVQGNHRASVAAGDPVPEGLELEVLHLPWRSWAQYEHRVEAAGRAYESNPDLTPSPNHHGMRDYRRLQEGVLPAYFALRSIADADAAADEAANAGADAAADAAHRASFVRDDSLADFLRMTRPKLGHPIIGGEDTLYPTEEASTLAAIGRALVGRDRAAEAAEARAAKAEDEAALWKGTHEHERARADRLQELVTLRERELAAMRARRVVRIADRLDAAMRRSR